MAADRLGPHVDVYLGKVEVGIYCVLAALLLLTALATMVSAGRLLWEAASHATIAAQTLRVLDELLVALMLAEILHTVRISIRSHVLVTEPSLVMELDTLTKRGGRSTASASLFWSAWIASGRFSVFDNAVASLPNRGERS